MSDEKTIKALLLAGGFTRAEVLSIEGSKIFLRMTQPFESTGSNARWLMSVENYLQSSLGHQMEVYLIPRRDDNKPRQRQEKVLDWVKRRGMLSDHH